MWFVYTLLTSFFVAAYYFGNQVAKLDAKVFMFYRGAVPALVFLPFKRT